MSNETDIQEGVKEYYGETLQTNADLKTSACCTAEDMPDYLKKLTANIHDEVMIKFYGCGSPLPLALEGMTVLDLGCGSGRDCYILSQLVGAKGKVIGVDMTDPQLEVARRHVDYHTEKFGYTAPNVDFREGFIEDLRTANIEDNSVDVVVSNCVVNLSTNKEQVFSEIFRVLKPGGELYFSDVFADRRIPPALAKDKVLVGECLGGALYIEDFRRLLAKAGCVDYRLMNTSLLTLDDAEVKRMAGMIDFYSLTVRAFNVDLEDLCEDFGHVAYYNGTIEECPHAFVLDDHHTFKTGMPVPICGNTANMLGQSRFAKHFRIAGDFSVHYGAFDCGPSPSGSNENASGSCC